MSEMARIRLGELGLDEGGESALLEVVVVRRRWGWNWREGLRRRRAQGVLDGREEGNRIFIMRLELDNKKVSGRSLNRCMLR